jgi:YVTN family beta-propeller protein
MKTNVFSLKILLLLQVAIILSCSERERSNPLDPQGPSKSKDLFGVIATPGNDVINLEWNMYDFDNFEQFKVHRSTDSAGTFDVIARPIVNTYKDTLKTGYNTPFYYKVSLVVNGVESETSNLVSASPIDATPPSVTISSPIDDSTLQGNITIVANALDNDKIDTFELFINGISVASEDTSYIEFLWDTDVLDRGSEHTISVQSLDLSGNYSPKDSINVMIEKTKPLVDSVVLSLPIPVSKGPLSFTITFTTKMDTTIDPSVTFGTSSPYDSNKITGSWRNSTTWIGSFFLDESTGDGVNIIRVGEAASGIGLIMEDDISNTFTVDTASPVISDFSIQNGLEYISSITTTVTMSGEDAQSDITEMKLSSDSNFLNVDWIPFAGTHTYNLDEGNGTKTLFCMIKDDAGNVSSIISDSIILDTVSPNIIVTNPANGVTVSGSITIKADVTDTYSINNVTLIIDDVEVKSFADSPYEHTFDSTQYSDGTTHTILFNAVDSAGNSSESDMISIIADQSLPVVQVFSFNEPSPIKSGDYTITIDFSSSMDTDIEPVVTYGMRSPYVDNSVTGSWQNDTSWTGNISIASETSNGEYVFTVSKAEDALGRNIMTFFSSPITIDTEPPLSTSIVINEGAQYTISSEVTLLLSATDTASDVTDMFISNNSLFSEAVWEPYTTTKVWSLTESEGAKTVYVKYRDNAGNISDAISSTITFNQNPPEAAALENAEALEDGIHLLWTQNADSDFSYYDIRRSTSAGVSTASTLVATISENTTLTFTDSTIETGNTYYYRVFVYDVAGLYSGSNEYEIAFEEARGIFGVVTARETGSPIKDAHVTITPEVNSGEITDSSGAYSLAGISDSGEYVLTFSKTGYISLSITISVEEGGQVEQNASLLNLPEVIDFVNPGSISLSNPQLMALSSDGLRGYVTDTDQNIVAILDVASNALIGSIEVGDGPLGIASSPVYNQIFVANSLSDDISVIDGTTNQEIRRIDVGAYPCEVAVTPDGEYVLVTNKSDNTVSVVQVGTYTVTNTISVGSGPAGIIVLPDGSEAYVSNSEANTVSVIDLTSMSVVKTIFVSSGPLPLAVSHDGSKVYVANRFANTVSIIDVASQKVETTISVGEYPVNLAIASEGEYSGFLYVLNYSDSNMSIIDTNTHSVVDQTVSLGNYPVGLAVTPDGGKMFVVNDVNANVMVVEY